MLFSCYCEIIKIYSPIFYFYDPSPVRTRANRNKSFIIHITLLTTSVFFSPQYTFRPSSTWANRWIRKTCCRNLFQLVLNLGKVINIEEGKWMHKYGIRMLFLSHRHFEIHTKLDNNLRYQKFNINLHQMHARIRCFYWKIIDSMSFQ